MLIAVQSREQISQIQKQLAALHIPKEKVEVFLESPFFEKVMARYVTYDENSDRRVGWLRDFARYVNETQYAGNVAECGVYRGNFAFYINKYFPSKTLYLFDSFQSFSEADLQKERTFKDQVFLDSKFNTSSNDLFKSSVNIVMGKMTYPKRCIIKKGYIPETFDGITDEFCFVNLDMDLYQPMLAAMDFFYPKMISGGVILLHDFFNETLPGVKRAVDAFEIAHGQVAKIPIGDSSSIAIIK